MDEALRLKILIVIHPTESVNLLVEPMLAPCSQASGILDYQEINDIINQKKLKPTWDHTAGVKWVSWNSTQWVSYDD